jgi:hypothetical protein
MKLRTISLILFSFLPFLCFAMSPEEKAEFKAQLKAAGTSLEMERLVQAKLQPDQSILLDINSSRLGPVGFATYSNSNEPITPLYRAIVNAVEETFFEEMHPFFFQGANKDTELAKFPRYAWANPRVAAELTRIFDVKLALDKDGYVARSDQDVVERVKYVKNRVAEVSGENRLLGGKNDLSQRLQWFAHNNPGFGIKIVKYAGIGVLVAAVTGGIYYWYTSKSNEQADDEDNEADQETIKNDNINKGPYEIA